MTASSPAGVILMVHPSPDLYGSDRVFLESVSAFTDAGWRVVVTLPESGPLVPALVERGAEVELVLTPVLRKSYLSPVGLLRLAGATLRSLPASVRLLRRTRPALVLVNTVTVPVWIVLARMLRRPAVCHVHEAEGSASPAVRKLLYLPLLAATGLVVNSGFSLDVLAGTWPRLRRRAVVVYNGVVGPAAPAPPRPRLDGPVRLLFLGRLSARKGPQVAIEAVSELVAEGLDVQLGLLGAPFPGYEWFEDQLRRQVDDAGLRDRVEFLGFRPDIWPHVDAADIVLVPSTVDEPFGNTAVEAMLARRPLVVSATSGLREAAAGYRTATQVPPDDASALAGAVRSMVVDWARVAADGAADLALARERHAPEVFRREVRAAILKLSGVLPKED